MALWYKVSTTHIVEDEKGIYKQVTENYLFDAVNYTEAEAKATEQLAQGRNEFVIKRITKANFHEVRILEDQGYDKYFKAKVKYIIYDEKSQKEKVVPTIILLNGTTLENTVKDIIAMLGTIQDYVIASIEETDYLDVFRHEQEEEN